MTRSTDTRDSSPPAALPCEAKLSRRWAQDVLGLEAIDDPPVLRAAALRRLADDEFVLWPQGHVAITLLAGGELTELEQCTLAEGVGQQLHDEVTEFCQGFFDLSSAVRRRRWQQLRALSESYPRLTHQLDGLKPGLDLDSGLKVLVDETTQELIDVVLSAFVAWPSESAGRCRSAVQRFGSDPKKWSTAAETLKRSRPDVAKLMPDFLNRVHQLPWRANRMQVGRSKRLKLQQEQQVTTPVTQSSDDQADWWRLLLFAPAIVAVLRACVSMTSPPQPTPQQNFSREEVRRVQESLERQFGLERSEDGSFRVTPSDRSPGQHFHFERSEDGSYELVPGNRVPNPPDDSDADDDLIWSVPDYRIRPPKPQPPGVPSLRPQPPDPQRSLAPFQQPELRPWGNDSQTTPRVTGEGSVP